MDDIKRVKKIKHLDQSAGIDRREERKKVIDEIFGRNNMDRIDKTDRTDSGGIGSIRRIVGKDRVDKNRADRTNRTDKADAAKAAGNGAATADTTDKADAAKAAGNEIAGYEEAGSGGIGSIGHIGQDRTGRADRIGTADKIGRNGMGVFFRPRVRRLTFVVAGLFVFMLALVGVGFIGRIERIGHIGLIRWIRQIGFIGQMGDDRTITSPDDADSTNTAVGVARSIFDPQQFYGLSTSDGRLYFGRIAEASGEYYRLVDVFYKMDRTDKTDTVGTSKADNAGSTAEEQGKITLVKFGTEEYRPKDELLLPRGQVESIFELDSNSPILKAIVNYLKGTS